MIDRFRPDLILVSAGYDAHWRDPIGGVMLDVIAFAVFTRYLQDLAQTYCNGRLVFALEGGYDGDALGYSVAATLGLLLGEKEVFDPIGPPESPGFVWNDEAVIEELRKIQHLHGYRRRPPLPGPTPDEEE
jgi:acetoin utilization deacetylase AcuC-like enzyme